MGPLTASSVSPEGQGGNAAGYASVWLKGAHTVPVTGAITSIGQPVYIPLAGGALTATSGSTAHWGNALELKGAGTAPIRVRVRRV